MAHDLLQKVDEQSKSILEEYAVIEQYEQEVADLEDDISKLQDKQDEQLSFEVDKELNEKKNLLPKAKQHLERVKKNNGEKLMNKVAQIPVAQYLKQAVNESDETRQARKKAVNDFITAYDNIVQFNKDYGNTIIQEVQRVKNETAYSDITNKVIADLEPRFTHLTGAPKAEYQHQTQQLFYEPLKSKKIRHPDEVAQMVKGLRRQNAGK